MSTQQGAREWTLSGPKQVQQEDGTWVYVNRPIDPPLPEGVEVTVVPKEEAEGLAGALQPYIDKAAPHEDLWDGEDLRNFERAVAALNAYRSNPKEGQ